jgi:hypothetical protein
VILHRVRENPVIIRTLNSRTKDFDNHQDMMTVVKIMGYAQDMTTVLKIVGYVVPMKEDIANLMVRGISDTVLETGGTINLRGTVFPVVIKCLVILQWV